MARSTRGGRTTGDGEDTKREPVLPQDGDGPGTSDRKIAEETPSEPVTASEPPSGSEAAPQLTESSDAGTEETAGTKPSLEATAAEPPRDPWGPSTRAEDEVTSIEPATEPVDEPATTASSATSGSETTSGTETSGTEREDARDAFATESEAEADRTAATEPVTERGDAATTAAAPAATPAPPPRRGSVLAPIFGGIVAAGIGAAAVLYLFPDGWQADRGALEARLEALEDRPAPDAAAMSEAVSTGLAPLEDRLAALEAAEGESIASVEDRLAALTNRLDAAEGIDLDAVEQRLQGLAARIEAAEGDAPGPDLGPLERALDALDDRLAALEEGQGQEIAAAVRAALDDAQAEQEARARAIDEAAQALAAEQARLGARMALTELSVAAESGAPAPDALARVAAAGDPPTALDAFAQGLPTLAELQASFPEAARSALIAAPVSSDAPIGDRVTGFLRSQVGARSLAPRAGSDPDAVLSRAEAAVREGRLADALQEIEALPPQAAAELTAWRNRAERRTEALAALAEMQARLGSE